MRDEQRPYRFRNPVGQSRRTYDGIGYINRPPYHPPINNTVRRMAGRVHYQLNYQGEIRRTIDDSRDSGVNGIISTYTQELDTSRSPLSVPNSSMDDSKTC